MERNIRPLIDEKGFRSMREFERACGVAHSTLNNAIDSPNGLTNTSQKNFSAIARALGMTCEQLEKWVLNEQL